MAKVSKRLNAAQAKVVIDKTYALKDAIDLLKQTATAKFDETVDLIFNLNLDVKQSDQQLRGSIALPNGSGKNVRVLVVTDDASQQADAKSAGADRIINGAELAEVLSKALNFDIIITDPKSMPVFGRFGKVLGPKGLMPNPKTGSVTAQIGKAVVDVKKGRANFRTDKAGVVHTIVGKVSMSNAALLQNAEMVIETIKRAKPATSKGIYIKNLLLSTTMGPSVKISIT